MQATTNSAISANINTTETKVYAVPSASTAKAAENVAKFLALKATRPLTVNEAKLYLNATLKLDNLSASKLYNTLFGTDKVQAEPHIKEQVEIVWGSAVRPTFATFASYLPLGKDADGNPAPKQYVSVWDGLRALAAHNTSAKAAEKALRQNALVGAKAEKEAQMLKERAEKAAAAEAAKAEKAAEKAAADKAKADAKAAKAAAAK